MSAVLFQFLNRLYKLVLFMCAFKHLPRRRLVPATGRSDKAVSSLWWNVCICRVFWLQSVRAPFCYVHTVCVFVPLRCVHTACVCVCVFVPLRCVHTASVCTNPRINTDYFHKYRYLAGLRNSVAERFYKVGTGLYLFKWISGVIVLCPLFISNFHYSVLVVC